MHIPRLAVALSLFATPALVSAQQTSPDSMPHKGTWAAEAFLGTSTSGASILGFRSASVALLFGVDLSYSHASEAEGGFLLSSGTTSNVAARLGVRNYRGSSTERLRPVVGAGLRTSYSETSSVIRAWSAGAYGELGAVYLLTHHISLGGTGELQASYGKRKQTRTVPGGSQNDADQTVSSVAVSLMRVMIGVYF